jgi:hypothetical protein
VGSEADDSHQLAVAGHALPRSCSSRFSVDQARHGHPRRPEIRFSASSTAKRWQRSVHSQARDADSLSHGMKRTCGGSALCGSAADSSSARTPNAFFSACGWWRMQTIHFPRLPQCTERKITSPGQSDEKGPGAENRKGFQESPCVVSSSAVVWRVIRGMLSNRSIGWDVPITRKTQPPRTY